MLTWTLSLATCVAVSVMGFVLGPTRAGDEAANGAAITMLPASGSSDWAGSRQGIRMTISSPADAVIEGVAFRAVNGAPSQYVVGIWSSSHTVLAWAKTGSPDSDGWMQARFPKSVAVKGGVAYSLVYWAAPRSLANKAVRGGDVQVIRHSTGDAQSLTAPPPSTPTVTAASTPSPKTSASSSPSGGTSSGSSLSVASGPFPGASNTGVPSGTALKASGDLVVSKAGTVIDGYDVNGTIEVSASNVTIKNTRVRGKGFSSIRVHDGLSGVVIQDCEVNGQGTSGTAGSNGIQGTATVQRCDISGVENGITPDSGSVLRDNFVHNLGAPGAAHYDGIQIDGGLSGITIEHNTILNQFEQTSAVMIDNYFGPTSNITVNDNYLGGGGYTVYSDGQFSGGSISGVRFTNNRMVKGTFGFSSVNNNVVVDTGNTDAATGSSLHLN
jgi:hypothetical protein